MAIRSVTYASVLQQAAQLCFGLSRPNAADAATLNTYVNENAGEFWRTYWWPELMLTERRQFRISFSAAHAAGVEVYYPPAEAYFLSLRGPTSTVPAVLTGGQYVANYGDWIEAQETLDADDWLTLRVYIAGDTVRNPLTDLYYGCHTAHTAGVTIDLTKFGALIRFRRSLAYSDGIQNDCDSIEGAYWADPETCPEARLPFFLGTDVVVGGTTPKPWIKFRRRIPSWSGTVHDPAIAYVVNDQVYYGSDYYKALGSTSALPTVTASWEKILFPYVFKAAVPRAAYADWLDSEGQIDKAQRNVGRAQVLIEREYEEIERRQRQSRNLPVKSH